MPRFSNSNLEQPNPLAQELRYLAPISPRTGKPLRKYKAKSPEATARRIAAGRRNWDALQLAGIVNQLSMLLYQIEGRPGARPYTFSSKAEKTGSITAVKLRYAKHLAASVLTDIKAHNTDPKKNPLD